MNPAAQTIADAIRSDPMILRDVATLIDPAELWRAVEHAEAYPDIQDIVDLLAMVDAALSSPPDIGRARGRILQAEKLLLKLLK